MSAPLEADVVIIGSDVAGSLIAWRLAEAKLKPRARPPRIRKQLTRNNADAARA